MWKNKGKRNRVLVVLVFILLIGSFGIVMLRDKAHDKKKEISDPISHVMYVNSQGEYVYYNADKNKKTILTKNLDDCFEYENLSSFYQLHVDDMVSIDESFGLWVKKDNGYSTLDLYVTNFEDGSSEFIDHGVKQMVVADDCNSIFYEKEIGENLGNDLYLYDYKKKKSKKIVDDVYKWNKEDHSDVLFYIDRNYNLYRKEAGRHSKKIASDILKMKNVSDDCVFFVKKDGIYKWTAENGVNKYYTFEPSMYEAAELYVYDEDTAFVVASKADSKVPFMNYFIDDGINNRGLVKTLKEGNTIVSLYDIYAYEEEKGTLLLEDVRDYKFNDEKPEFWYYCNKDQMNHKKKLSTVLKDIQSNNYSEIHLKLGSIINSKNDAQANLSATWEADSYLYRNHKSIPLGTHKILYTSFDDDRFYFSGFEHYGDKHMSLYEIDIEQDQASKSKLLSSKAVKYNNYNFLYDIGFLNKDFFVYYAESDEDEYVDHIYVDGKLLDTNVLWISNQGNFSKNNDKYVYVKHSKESGKHNLWYYNGKKKIEIAENANTYLCCNDDVYYLQFKDVGADLYVYKNGESHLIDENVTCMW